MLLATLYDFCTSVAPRQSNFVVQLSALAKSNADTRDFLNDFGGEQTIDDITFTRQSPDISFEMKSYVAMDPLTIRR